ncbi:MAG: hypothetical protein O2925_10380 [Actinomycetota bacterium]|nr:hypothetical protein [Actinomycetota bacterium]MDA3012596.1 hypothetical protein [Actinomycetota bacterium]MDA3029191.1 hypothetical protein [Actinomycetota bacterium]
MNAFHLGTNAGVVNRDGCDDTCGLCWRVIGLIMRCIEREEF